MEEIFKQTPAIIEQAAKSPLGLLALMVIVLAAIGLVFFKDASEKTRIFIFVLLLAGAATFGYAAFSVSGPEPEQASGQVSAIDIDGTWSARVDYGWAAHDETFQFESRAGALFGKASFLQTPRGILNAELTGNRVRFDTRTTSIMGNESRESIHHYHGLVDGDTIEFVLQSEGGFGSAPPIEFVARKEP